jgi:ribonuclease-3
MLDPRRTKELKKLIEKLGLTPTAEIDWSLLDIALTHSSFSGECNYEQLEFIGDSVVRLATSEFLLSTYPDASVGEFSAIRKVLVSDVTLAQLARSFGFDRYLLIAPSAAGDQGGEMSRLADAFEAVLGVLYLSTASMKLIRPWLDPLLQDLATEIRNDPARKNYKDALQEWTQGKYKMLPTYHVEETAGHGSKERFTAQVWLKDECLGKGTGRSKKAAEQSAAKKAFFGVVGKNV